MAGGLAFLVAAVALHALFVQLALTPIGLGAVYVARLTAAAAPVLAWPAAAFALRGVVRWHTPSGPTLMIASTTGLVVLSLITAALP